MGRSPNLQPPASKNFTRPNLDRTAPTKNKLARSLLDKFLFITLLVISPLISKLLFSKQTLLPKFLSISTATKTSLNWGTFFIITCSLVKVVAARMGKIAFLLFSTSILPSNFLKKKKGEIKK